jgi:hypothetical protein
LWESCYFWHFSYLFLAPVGLNLQLMLQNFDLSWAFSFSFLNPILILLLIVVVQHIRILVRHGFLHVQII